MNGCRRHFDFSESTLNHPRTFTRDDLSTVLASGADFARKVDEAGFPGVLEAVDRSLRAVGDESSRSVALAS